MNCIIPTLNIDINDSVGDSVGKHNYNVLSLDTTICNLSSIFYNNDSNLLNIFNNFSSLVSNYKTLSASYTEAKVDNILRAITTVNVLSAAWSHLEFSVLYPIDANRSPLVLKSTNTKDIDNFVDAKLKHVGQSWLTTNYSTKDYPQNTIIDLTFFPYSYAPNIKNSDHLLATAKSPKSFGYWDRLMNVNLSRESVYISQAIIVQFQNINNVWTYVNYIFRDSVYSPLTFVNTLSTSLAANQPLSLPNLNKNKIDFIKDSVWTVPDGITSITVVAIGGGGGGGGATANHKGGDANGGHELDGVIPVAPGDKIKISIGYGGYPGFNNKRPADFGGNGGKNSLNYNGGNGGSLGKGLYGGSGGGGGGATVVSINDKIKLIAAGGGGGGGAGTLSAGQAKLSYTSSGAIAGNKGTNKTSSSGGAGGGGGGGLNGGIGGIVVDKDNGAYAGSDGKDYVSIQGFIIRYTQNGGKGAPIKDTYTGKANGFGWGQEGGSGSVSIFY
jgi:hypothetical protein